MSTIKHKKFSRDALSDVGTVENGTRFEHCNFSQYDPNTAILEGVTGLEFYKCNLLNCSIPADATTEICLTIQKEFCTNKHPKLIGKGDITTCAEDCDHVVDTDTVTIDGVVVETIYNYEDTLL